MSHNPMDFHSLDSFTFYLWALCDPHVAIWTILTLNVKVNGKYLSFNNFSVLSFQSSYKVHIPSTWHATVEA
jgi:hypothetical protein